MSDQELRSLEREAAGSSDPRALERLQIERVRRGLGWHGERLPFQKDGPGFMVPKTSRWSGRDEVGVYLWGAGVELGPLQDSNDPPPAVFMDFVYVPGGTVDCSLCRGDGTRPHQSVGEGPRRLCEACAGDGKKVIAPFYIGRFPVTSLQWRAFEIAESRGRAAGGLHSDLDHHPIVNVSLQDAKEFCSWAGLRLPSAEEWKWAALGGKEHQALYYGASCAICKAPLQRVETGPPKYAYVRARCPIHGEAESVYLVEPRRYPWGNEPPTPERCVWAGYLDSQFAQFGTTRPGGASGFSARLTGTLPVVAPDKSKGVMKCRAGHAVAPRGPGQHTNGATRCVEYSNGCTAPVGVTLGPLVPARPSGASWCGAQDMAGNVWEWVADGSAHGGSFRNDLAHTPGPHGFAGSHTRPFASRLGRWDHRQDASTAADDVGFRVAISGVPS